MEKQLLMYRKHKDLYLIFLLDEKVLVNDGFLPAVGLAVEIEELIKMKRSNEDITGGITIRAFVINSSDFNRFEVVRIKQTKRRKNMKRS